MAMRGMAFLMVGALLLAGCAGDKGEPTDEAGVFEGLEDQAEATKTTGAIAGVVVDDAIRPLPGANVTLVAANKTVQADAEGRFTFEGLEPGVVFLSADARRFNPTQVSVDVVAGEVATVRILLTRMTSAEPYHVTLQFRGHIDAYLGEVSFAGQLLSPGTLNCICEWSIIPDGNLSTVMFEATGTSQVSNPDTPATNGGDAYWELWEQDGEGSGHTAYAFYPIVERITLEDATAPFEVRITGGAYVTGAMDYDLFVTLFYREDAPEGWSFLNGSV